MCTSVHVAGEGLVADAFLAELAQPALGERPLVVGQVPREPRQEGDEAARWGTGLEFTSRAAAVDTLTAAIIDNDVQP